MSANLLDLFNHAVNQHGDKVALIESNGNEVTFIELANRAKAFAATWSSQGIQPGDRVLVAMPVAADLYASLAALWSLGVTAVLPEPAMGLSGVRHAVKATNCKGIVASGYYQFIKALLPRLWFKPLFKPKTKPVVEVNKSPPVYTTAHVDSIALISFTSGSTGEPKAIARSHGFLTAQHAAIAPLLDSATKEKDLVAFPVFVLVNLASGRTSVLPNWRLNKLDKLTSDTLASWIKTQKVTRALLPPSACETLSQCPPLPSLTTVFTGGGPVFLDLAERIADRHPQLRIVAVYGSTEAEPIAHLEFASVTDEDKQGMQNGNGLLAGHPVPQVQIRLIDDEILVAGEHVNKGYLDPARDAETKVYDADVVYHRTGDAGRLDDKGRIWLLGRHGKSINNLYPFAVEAAVRLWPGVTTVALTQLHGNALLAIEGDITQLQTWQSEARKRFSINDVRHVTSIPLDRRHRSKIDYAALAKQLNG